MNSWPIPEIACKICGEPLDLSLDLSADERGRAVHTDCYVHRLLSARSPRTVEMLFDEMAMQKPILRCPKCGRPVSHVNTTFLSRQGRTWTPLLFCGNCDERGGSIRQACA